jgi:hypothetical protein
MFIHLGRPWWCSGTATLGVGFWAVPGRGGGCWPGAVGGRALGTGEGAEAGAKVRSGWVRSRDILRGRPGPRQAPGGAGPGHCRHSRGTRVRPEAPKGRAERAPWRCTE